MADNIKNLWTLDDLYNVGTVVGPLDTQSFDSLERTATRLAARMGIKNPKLVIDRKYKPRYLSLREKSKPHEPAPLIREIWAAYVKEARTMMEEIPDVYLIDGDKYTASI